MKKGELLGAMLVLATTAHAGQFDKAGQPYILHCLKVLHYLKSDDEQLQCIAVGHDIIEDTKTTYEDLLNAGMTTRIIEGIADLTKMPGETYKAYKTKVLNNSDARKVKLADLRHNSDLRRMKGVSEKDIKRVAKYMEFYAEIQTREAAE